MRLLEQVQREQFIILKTRYDPEVGKLTPDCSLWTCSKSLMPYSIQFINNYKFLLRSLLEPAFLLFFLSPTVFLKDFASFFI